MSWWLLHRQLNRLDFGGGGVGMAIAALSLVDALFHEELFISRRHNQAVFVGTLEFSFTRAISRENLYWAKTGLVFLGFVMFCLPILVSGFLSNQGSDSILLSLVWLAGISMVIPFAFLVRHLRWRGIYPLRGIVTMGLLLGGLYTGFAWASAHPEAFYMAILPFVGGMLWLGERLFVRREVTD